MKRSSALVGVPAVLGALVMGFEARAQAQSVATITVTNTSPSVAMTCSLGGASFTVAPGATESRVTGGATEGTCGEIPGQGVFRLSAPTSTHVVRCTRQSKYALTCTEVYNPAEPPVPLTTVVLHNGSFLGVECRLPAERVVSVPAGTSSAVMFPGDAPLACLADGRPLPIVLSSTVRAHTVRCASVGKYGVSCVEVPETGAAPAAPASPPPAAPPRPTAASPRVVSTFGETLMCRAVKPSGATATIEVPPGGQERFAFDDVKTEALQVTCSAFSKTIRPSVVNLPSPHPAPATVTCTKGAAGNILVCSDR